MTQHYQRTAMAPMPSGMPIIPPRLQLQQQQELLMNNRRQQQQQQYSPISPQQQLPFRANNNNAQNSGPLPFTGHTRSVSSGGGAPSKARPSNGPHNNYNNDNNNYHPHQPHNNYINSNNNNNGYNYQQGQPGGRLRSESNPHYRSDHNNNSNSSFYSGNKRNNGPSRANTTGTSGTSFQDRMKERDRERQVRERDERDAAARAIREDPKLSSVLDSSAATTTAAAAAAAATTAQSTGTNLWNRFLAAKDVITGEERWPDSDDSDHEGESHVSRVLREYADKKEARELAARIEELERMPITPAPSSLTASGSSGSTYSGRSRTLREAIRHDNTSPTSPAPAPAAAPTSLASPASSSDYYGRSLRARGEAGHQASRSEDTSHRPPIRTREIGHRPAGALSPPTSPDTATPSPSTSTSNSSATLETPRIGNRFRTSSDASLSMALGRLEGKRNQDALVAQVSHLGSTRARSPHRGNRAYREHIDVAPPPPLPTPKSDYRQQRQPLSPSSSSASLRCQNSSSRRNGALAQQQQQQQPVDHGLDDYGQRLQQLQQQEQQQQQTQQARYF